MVCDRQKENHQVFPHLLSIACAYIFIFYLYQSSPFGEFLQQRTMSTLDEREAYKNNPYFTGHIYGNFSPFYVTIAVCAVVLGSIIILNIILGCCSKYREYWQDRHTGNRWLVSIWSATPHKQPPLDLTELKDVSYFRSLHVSLTFIYVRTIDILK